MLNKMMRFWYLFAVLGAALIAFGLSVPGEHLKALLGLPGMLILGLGVGLWWCKNDPTTNPDNV